MSYLCNCGKEFDEPMARIAHMATCDVMCGVEEAYQKKIYEYCNSPYDENGKFEGHFTTPSKIIAWMRRNPPPEIKELVEALKKYRDHESYENWDLLIAKLAEFERKTGVKV